MYSAVERFCLRLKLFELGAFSGGGGKHGRASGGQSVSVRRKRGQERILTEKQFKL
jgi:hypothetical protein